MKNTLALNRCIHNDGKHIVRTQQPVRCELFQNWLPAITKCINCEVHFPKGRSDEQ